MSLYARRFGIRDYSNIVRNGRHVNDVDLVIGSAGVVAPSGASAGKVVAPAAGASANALSGIVLYEHVFAPDITLGQTSDDLSTAPAGKYVQLVSGQGAKVFLVNSGSITINGVVRAAITTVDGSIAVGNGLKPSSSAGQWTAAAAGAGDWMTIESVSGSTANGGQQTIEARLLF
jgi:hypothetical protein